MGRDALKVVLNFFLGARGRRCVSGNLMFAFCGASSAAISRAVAGNHTTIHGREDTERVREKGTEAGMHACQKKQEQGEANYVDHIACWRHRN